MAHAYYNPKEKELKNAYADMLNTEQEKDQGNISTMLESIDLLTEADQVKSQILTKENQLRAMAKLIESDIECAVNHKTNVNLFEALEKVKEAVEALERAKKYCKAE
jgi:hypothetical protein